MLTGRRDKYEFGLSVQTCDLIPLYEKSLLLLSVQVNNASVEGRISNCMITNTFSHNLL
jgi:hypothetical protein